MLLVIWQHLKYKPQGGTVIMGNDPVLTKIYNKIHKKLPLTFDDLRYLSDYAPECFEKTCNKIVNKM